MIRIATLPLLLLLAVPARAEELTFGSWRLSCSQDRMTDRADCRLAHRDWADPPSASRPGLALEVMDRGGRALPVITARDLGMEGASRGILALTGTAQLRFPPNPFFELPCGLEGRTLVCAPRAEDAARAAGELPGADRVLLRVLGIGGSAAEPVEMRLSDTRPAIAALRARMPEGAAPAPASTGVDLRDILQRLQRFFAP
ncbi:hypothetical protein C8P66_12287 [Humitalea rosea]|uniref:Invasion protein IalB n=1 Tax=Humitalea rosea TaxID=990373 RepID=A0A2W7K0F8_9PROT|nr:hypothetical protein [Humitalea rosea]PZW41100.1 hypothetical protein C8P66_12287 [Humitalea rosea]